MEGAMDQDVRQAEEAQADGGAAPPKACTVHAALVPRLNLADFQNAVPALTELAIVNGTDKPLLLAALVTRRRQHHDDAHVGAPAPAAATGRGQGAPEH
jgi:hypothetical protein